jgi:hypothetical protein
MRPVRSRLFAKSIRHFDRRATGIHCSLDHERGNGIDKQGHGHAALRLTVFRNKARHLAATRRMADMDRIPQVEMLDHCRRLVRVMVHIVTSVHQQRAAITAPVMCADAIAAGRKNSIYTS